MTAPEPTEASAVTEDPVIQALLNHDRVDDWGVMEEDELREYVDLAREIREHITDEHIGLLESMLVDAGTGDAYYWHTRNESIESAVAGLKALRSFRFTWGE